MQEIALRVLITGANGFVGRHLIARLLGVDEQESAAAAPVPGVQIYAGVHPAEMAGVQAERDPAFDVAGWTGGTAGGRIRIVEVELTEPDRLTALIAEVRPQQIYHLAARASGADSDREAVFATNVTGTRNLLEAASLIQPFPRVLLASTGYVYGNTDPDRPAREEDPIGPLWKFGAYTDSKIEMETMARAYRGLALISRSFAHTGPGQSPVFAVPTFARQVARIEAGLEPPQLNVGNLEAWRDLMDVRDVVRAYARMMAQGTVGETYNVATGNPVQMQSVVERLCALSRVTPEIVVDPARLRPLDIACSTGDPLRLRNATDWAAQRSVESLLRDMLDYWRTRL